MVGGRQEVSLVIKIGGKKILFLQNWVRAADISGEGPALSRKLLSLLHTDGERMEMQLSQGGLRSPSLLFMTSSTKRRCIYQTRKLETGKTEKVSFLLESQAVTNVACSSLGHECQWCLSNAVD